MSAFDGVGRKEESVYAVYGAVDIDSLSREQIAAAEDALQAAEFLHAIMLVNAFLDHLGDGAEQTRQKLYRKMLFTEELTYSAKRLANYEECAPFERHERDAFCTAELPFQDIYTVDSVTLSKCECRSIRALWDCDIRENVGPANIRKIYKPGDAQYSETATWQLPADLFISYLHEVTGEKVTRQAISRQRDNYRAMMPKPVKEGGFGSRSVSGFSHIEG